MEVTEMMDKHPEILAEVEAIEESMMAFFAQEAGDGPSANVLSQALSQIENGGESIAPVIPLQREETPIEKTPAVETETLKEDSPEEEIPVVPLTEQVSEGDGMGLYKFLAIAASLALLTSIVLNVFFYTEWQKSDARIASIEEENRTLAYEFEKFRTNYRSSSTLLHDSTTLRVSLKERPNFPGSFATVYWNQGQEKILLHSGSLPEAPEGFQYQLWALVGGQPINAGVFDSSIQLQTMKSLPVVADAFAVTLEPRGGSVNPTMEKMYVLGEV